MYLLLLTMKTTNGIIALCILLYTIVLAAMCPILRRKEKNTAVLILCILPVIAALIHFCLYGSLTFDKFKYLYIESLIPLVCLLPFRSKIFGAGRSFLVIASSFILCSVFLIDAVSHPMVHSFTRKSYTESFCKMLDTLEREYCLNSWKRIDYDALLNDYLPQVKEAEKNGDETKYAAIITEVAYRFYDSHVSVSLSSDIHYSVDECLAGNDYGFTMIRTDDGKVIAVLADTYSKNNPDGLYLNDQTNDIYDIGIHDGTQILSWDGTDINDALEKIECISPVLHFPVKTNEDIYRPLFLSGKGGDSVNVSFVGDDGKEHNAEIKKIGLLNSRISCAHTLLSDMIPDHQQDYTCMLDEKCGYLQVISENSDMIRDNIAVVRHGYYPELTEYYAGLISELKSQGMEYLVIDIRNNHGGYDCCAGALASLFTDEKKHLVSFGYEDSSGYHIKEDQYLFPDGRYRDLPIAVLVNNECMSAGDGLAKYLGDCNNVTLMGIASSSGVNQNNGGYIYLTNNICLNFPCFLSLSSDGKPLIDTDHTRENRIPLDVSIPMTKEMALNIFSLDRLASWVQNHEAEEIDPELEYAMNYLENSLS